VFVRDVYVEQLRRTACFCLSGLFALCLTHDSGTASSLLFGGGSLFLLSVCVTSVKGHMVDALASRADEGRTSLR
jgi:hypothetical protein